MIKMLCTKLKECLKNDFKTTNSEFYSIVLKSLIIQSLLVLGCFVKAFLWVAFAVVILFIISHFNSFRNVYFLIALLPYTSIFSRFPGDKFLIGICVLAVILTNGSRLIIKFIKKEQKLDIPFCILIGVFVLYILIFANYSNLTALATLLLGIALIVLMYFLHDEIDSKEIALIFTMGLMTSCLFGLLRPYSQMMQETISLSYAMNKVRYSGLYVNTNMLYGEILIAFSLISYQYIKQKVNIVYYLSLIFSEIVLFLTYSKMGFILFFIIIGITLILKLTTKSLEIKKKMIQSITLLVIVVAIMLINWTNIAIILKRLKLEDSPQSGVEDVVDDNQDEFVEDFDNSILDSFTTGRTKIWKDYIKKTFSTPESAILGFGIGAEYIGNYNGVTTFGPHNTLINVLYEVGILGAIMILSILIYVLIKSKVLNNLLTASIPLVTVCIYLFSESWFSYRGCLYLMCVMMCIYNNTNKKSEEENHSHPHKIPKTIHYIWLGGNPLPKVAEQCIESWKKYCPDYEIKRWDESNLNIDCCTYCREAYDSKKFAFASDVLRFDVLSKEGGIYLDIDVEMLKPIDDLLVNNCFMGFETHNAIAPGLILGCEKDDKTINDLYETYKNDKFILDDGSFNLNTICTRTTNYLVEKGLKLDNSLQEIDGVTIYPTEYFCPLSPITSKKKITEKTYAMHLYYSSWYNKKAKFKKECKKILNFITNGLFGMALYKLRKQRSRKNEKHCNSDTVVQ